MRIIHIGDVLGDLESLERVIDFANDRKADVLSCTGDLLGNCLTRGQAERMYRAFNSIVGRVRADKSTSFREVLRHIRDHPDAWPRDIKDSAEDYAGAEMQFDANSSELYRNIRALTKECLCDIVMIPGNNDSSGFFDFFGNFIIHKCSVSIKGVKFSGYGGARQIPVSVPPTRVIDFSEDELYNSLMREDPDVALTHVPPYGLNDIVSEGDKRFHGGSFANLAYIRGQCPSLVLCSHIRESAGVACEGSGECSTLVVNSGALGQGRDILSRTFFELELGEENYPVDESICPYSIKNGEITALSSH